MADLTKECGRCGESKPLAEFGKRRLSPDGLQTWCKRCMAENQKEWLAAHPDKIAEHREKARLRMKEKYHSDPDHRERVKQRSRDWKAALSQEERMRRDRLRWFRSQYDLTPEQVEELWQAQESRCSCCGKETKHKVVDHDHATKKVRGLLCRACNSGIGSLGDDIAGVEKALAYLKRHEALMAEE